jgi:replication factor C large subunit
MIKYTRVHKASIASHLKKIADMEKLIIPPDVIRSLAEKSDGDLRAAINDLQALASMGAVSHFPESIGVRDREEDIFKVLAAVFNAKEAGSTLSVINSLDMEPAELLTWILDNAVEIYKDPRILWQALGYLARADMVLQTILKSQRWGLLKYFYALISGVGLGGGGSHGMRFTYPSKIRFMAQTRAERETIEFISRKIAEKCHLSTYKARKEMLPFVAFLVGKNKEMARFLGLDDSEVKYLIRSQQFQK